MLLRAKPKKHAMVRSGFPLRKLLAIMKGWTQDIGRTTPAGVNVRTTDLSKVVARSVGVNHNVNGSNACGRTQSVIVDMDGIVNCHGPMGEVLHV